MDAASQAAHAHDVHHHDAPHHELNFWQKYIFSTDHKVIGIQYGVMALLFLFFGFSLMAMMRWSMAYPGQPMPLVGSALHAVLGPDAASPVLDKETGKIVIGYAMTSDLYNAFGAMHGTIMARKTMMVPCIAPKAL